MLGSDRIGKIAVAIFDEEVVLGQAPMPQWGELTREQQLEYRLKGYAAHNVPIGPVYHVTG